MAERADPHRREQYRSFVEIQTRWDDNDAYGHVNNVQYYSYIDTAVTLFLVQSGLLDYANGERIGLAVESACHYFAPASFPERLTAGIRIGRLGGSSVRYEVAIFREGEETALAQGHFVHVYVSRSTMRPAPLDDHWRDTLKPLLGRESPSGG